MKPFKDKTHAELMADVDQREKFSREFLISEIERIGELAPRDMPDELSELYFNLKAAGCITSST